MSGFKDPDQPLMWTNAKEEKLQAILVKFHSHMKKKNDELNSKLITMPSIEGEILQSENYLFRLNEQKQLLGQKLRQLQTTNIRKLED